MVTTPDPQHAGVQLLGGDMQMWSDFDLGRQSDDLAAMPYPTKLWALLLRPILSDVTGSVLLVGPEAAKLLPFLPENAGADVVVRSRTDAGVIVAARPGTRVWAGSFDRFEAPREYDMVITLDPVERLATPDDEPLSSQTVVSRLSSWVADGGSSMLLVRNRVGVDALVAERHFPGPQWEALDPGLARRELQKLVDDAQLISVVGETPSVLVGKQIAEDERFAGLLTNAACNALLQAVEDDEILRDPISVLPSIVESGEFEQFAPSWLVVRGVDGLAQLLIDVDTTFVAPVMQPTDGLLGEPAAGGKESANRAKEPVGPEFMPALDPSWARWIEVDGEGVIVRGQARDTVLGPLCRESGVRIDVAEASQSLEAVWRRAAATVQLEPLRDLLRDWSRWVDEMDPEQAWFAFPDNAVVLSDGTHALLDPTWRWLGKEELDSAKIFALRRFALRLLRSGATHPWPVNLSLDGVTESLALMAGVDWDEELLLSAIRVGERMRLLSSAPDESLLDDAVERALVFGRQHQLSLGASMGREAQQRLLNQLSNEAAAQQLKVDWYERHVRRRDGQLNGLERQLESIEASVPYKIARATTWPGRAAIRGAKGLVKRALPPSAWQRLIAVAKKRLR